MAARFFSFFLLIQQKLNAINHLANAAAALCVRKPRNLAVFLRYEPTIVTVYAPPLTALVRDGSGKTQGYTDILTILRMRHLYRGRGLNSISLKM